MMSWIRNQRNRLKRFYNRSTVEDSQDEIYLPADVLNIRRLKYMPVCHAGGLSLPCHSGLRSGIYPVSFSPVTLEEPLSLIPFLNQYPVLFNQGRQGPNPWPSLRESFPLSRQSKGLEVSLRLEIPLNSIAGSNLLLSQTYE